MVTNLDPLLTDHTLLYKFFSIQICDGILVGDVLVHDGLGKHWIVTFIVTMTTVANLKNAAEKKKKKKISISSIKPSRCNLKKISTFSMSLFTHCV